VLKADVVKVNARFVGVDAEVAAVVVPWYVPIASKEELKNCKSKGVFLLVPVNEKTKTIGSVLLRENGVVRVPAKIPPASPPVIVAVVAVWLFGTLVILDSIVKFVVPNSVSDVTAALHVKIPVTNVAAIALMVLFMVFCCFMIKSF
jgi:hypothetical protein